MSETPDSNSQPDSAVSAPTTRFIFDQVTEYAVKEIITRPDAFKVEKLPEKTTVFITTGKVVSFHGRKTLLDTDGNKLFKFAQNVTSTLLYMYIYDYTKSTYYTLRKKAWLPGRGRNTVLIWEGKTDEGNPIMEMQAQNISKTKFVIRNLVENRDLAVTSRSALSARRLLTGTDLHNLTVYPGVDAALMVMLTIALDEQYTEYVS